MLMCTFKKDIAAVVINSDGLRDHSKDNGME